MSSSFTHLVPKPGFGINEFPSKELGPLQTKLLVWLSWHVWIVVVAGFCHPPTLTLNSRVWLPQLLLLSRCSNLSSTHLLQVFLQLLSPSYFSSPAALIIPLSSTPSVSPAPGAFYALLGHCLGFASHLSDIVCYTHLGISLYYISTSFY